jgi:hypothetical protein
MSEERRRKQTQRMVDQAFAKSGRKPWWKSTGAWVVTLIGLASACVTFYPRPVLTPSDNRDPQHPFRLIVILSNNNIVPLEDVRVSFVAEDIVQTDGGHAWNNTFLRDDWTASRLGADDKLDIDISRTFGGDPGSVASATVKIKVRYHSWFIPYPRLKEFPFRAVKQRDGTIRLMAIPAG